MKEYTVTEAAELLRVDRTTVLNWINSGKMQARKSGLGRTSAYKISEEVLRDVASQLGLSLNGKQR